MTRHAQTVARISHSHESSEINASNEKRTLLVVLLTGVTMAVEIIAGHLTGSMALLADGWHMGTHAFALGISYVAYLLARKHKHSEYFTFGTGKFGVLAGYTSALFLAGVGLNSEKRKRQHKLSGKDFDRLVIIKYYNTKQEALIAENSLIRFNGMFSLGLENSKFFNDEYFNIIDLNECNK